MALPTHSEGNLARALHASDAAMAATWQRCKNCDELIYRKRLVRHSHVCPSCGYHFRLSTDERLAHLLDPGTLVEDDTTVAPEDLLGFVDTKPYPERLSSAQRRTGRNDAATAGRATIGGRAVEIALVDFAFMGGSIGSVAGELISRAADRARRDRVPLLLITASGGARMQEGAISLMQMAKTSHAIAEVHQAGLLCVNLNTDPTYGGATASFATLGDLIIAEPGAMIGFAGPQVIEQTIRQELPSGFQTAGFLRECGLVDLVLPRDEVRTAIAEILRLHDGTGELPTPDPDADPVITDPGALATRPIPDLLRTARSINRPTTLDLAATVFDSFRELHGDRLGADDAAIVGGLALLGEQPVLLIGNQKGHSTQELIERNFGMAHPAGYNKVLRLLRHAAKFRLPVVTLVDTPGAYPGVDAERQGQGHAIARCIMESSVLPVPVVSVITGEGGSGGALALATGNRVLMMENSYYSVISPEGCSTILWGSAASSLEAAAALRLSAPELLRLGVVDGIVAEPAGETPEDQVHYSANLRRAISDCLHELSGLAEEELIAQRRRRFRGFGPVQFPQEPTETT